MFLQQINMTIHKEKIVSTDPRLNRHIEHDSRSLNYTFDTSNLSVIDVTHERLVPVFNQGQVGSCTGNAGNGVLNTSPFLPNKVFTPDEAGALNIYNLEEKMDGGIGYPPEDNGSSGLTCAKVLFANGVISSYQHTFTLNDALKALSLYPIITGTNWTQDMFNPDPDGRVHPTGAVAGGHEYEGFKVDVENGRIWFWNSWGAQWGLNGTFYMTWLDYATLLAQNGDVTVLIPPNTPVPAPVVTVNITRNASDSKETTGQLTTSDGQFGCKTLERPNLNNQPNISCIPTGTYKCIWAYMNDLKEYHYLIQNVPNRTGIFIHEGNYYTNSLGCVLLGGALQDINGDKEPDVINSKAILAQFETKMAQKPFILTIQ